MVGDEVIGLAFQHYQLYNGCLPAARSCDDGASWAVMILPYLEQDNLYQRWEVGKSYYMQPAVARQTGVKAYFCPSRRTASSEPAVSVWGDSPMEGPLAGTLFPGALADYAASVGSTGPTFS